MTTLKTRTYQTCHLCKYTGREVAQKPVGDGRFYSPTCIWCDDRADRPERTAYDLTH